MSIQEQIKALTQELRPRYNGETFYWFDTATLSVRVDNKPYPEYDSQSRTKWNEFNFASTIKAEVEEYADCYRRLRLYQLLAQKAALKYPIDWSVQSTIKHGFDATLSWDGQDGIVYAHSRKQCCLGGVYFSRLQDLREALKICGIDRAFQEKCAKYGLGGA